jgi:hypothetical protein
MIVVAVQAMYAIYGWNQLRYGRVLREMPCASRAFLNRMYVKVTTEKLMSCEAVTYNHISWEDTNGWNEDLPN